MQTFRRNIMKKISTIIALALIVTISSVYAAWSYSQGAAAGSEITREINMAQVNTSGNKGSITATPSNFAFLVDDVDAKDYIAALVGTGELQVNFTPNAGSDANLATEGIKMIATVTIKHEGTATTYTGVNAAGETVTVIPVKAKTNNVINLTGDGKATTATLTAEQILSVLDFCVDSTTGSVVSLKLPTKAANDAFHSVLKNYTIVINITEVVD